MTPDHRLWRVHFTKMFRRDRIQFYNFTGFRADSMLEDLPANLKLQLDIVMNRSLFLKVPAFRDCSLPQICELVPRIVRQYALGGQFIVRQGQPGLGLFMIYRGVCEVSLPLFFGRLQRQVSIALPPTLCSPTGKQRRGCARCHEATNFVRAVSLRPRRGRQRGGEKDHGHPGLQW